MCRPRVVCSPASSGTPHGRGAALGPAIGLGLCWYARRPPRHSEELPQPGDEESAPSEGEGERPWRGPYEAEFHKTAEALAGEILEKGEFWEGKDVPTGGILPRPRRRVLGSAPPDSCVHVGVCLWLHGSVGGCRVGAHKLHGFRFLHRLF